MNEFGNRIRELRILHNVRQHQIAALLKTDTAFVSKMEKGLRRPKKEQVIAIAKLFNIDQEQLLTPWLADQILDLTLNEPVALDALQVAEKEIKYHIKAKYNGVEAKD